VASGVKIFAGSSANNGWRNVAAAAAWRAGGIGQAKTGGRPGRGGKWRLNGEMGGRRAGVASCMNVAATRVWKREGGMADVIEQYRGLDQEKISAGAIESEKGVAIWRMASGGVAAAAKTETTINGISTKKKHAAQGKYRAVSRRKSRKLT